MLDNNSAFCRASTSSPKERVTLTYCRRDYPLWVNIRDTPWVAFMRRQVAVGTFAIRFVRE